jgi:hypothetical protein
MEKIKNLLLVLILPAGVIIWAILPNDTNVTVFGIITAVVFVGGGMAWIYGLPKLIDQIIGPMPKKKKINKKLPQRR